LGENIRAARKHAGMTQETLAEKADLHPVYISSVERGQENVSIDSLARISKTLQIAIRDLLAGL
jgi:transcriptional regulator with XRE-family HTH domain